MTYDQLAAFIAVIEHGSFRSAAKAIHKTQSTISASVKNLEQELDIQLLDRTQYRPRLTPQGEVFFEQAKKTIRQFDRLNEFGRHLASGDDPSLAIVMSGICALPPILEIIKKNIAAYPKTAFSISTEHMSGVLEKLNNNQYDLAIGPGLGVDHRHEYAQIGTVTIMSVSAAGFITSKKTPVSQAEMRSYVHILVSDSGVEAPKSHVNIIPGGSSWVVNDYASKKQLILAGLGWGRLPFHMISRELEAGLLVPLKIQGIPGNQEVPIFIIRKLSRSPGPVSQHLWDQMCAFGV